MPRQTLSSFCKKIFINLRIKLNDLVPTAEGGGRRELRRTKRRRKSSINWKLWKVCFGPDFGGNRRIKFLKFQPTLYDQKKAKLHAPKVAAKVLKKLKQSTRNTSACAAAVSKVRLKLVFINFKCIFSFRRGKLWQLGEAAHSHRYTLQLKDAIRQDVS